MGRRSLDATNVRFSFCARAVDTFARDLPFDDADFFLAEEDLLDDLLLADFFFAEEVLVLLLDFFVVVSPAAGAGIPGASSAKIRR
jgi:hypothetical protein